MNNFMSIILTPEFFFSVIRITSPILFATLGAVIVEKAGISNIGLEGTMMIAALFGSLVAYWTSSWMIGLLTAILVGVLISLLMSLFAFRLQTDVILVGVAINMIGSGGTLFFVKVFTKLSEGQAMASTTSLITSNLQIPTIQIPLLAEVPILGPIFSGHSLLTYVAFLCVFLTWVLLYKTPLGLNLRSVGENPNAAASVGVSVSRIRYIAMMLSGVMAGLGGAFLSMSYAMGWSQDMVAGRGFIALAAQSMGNGEPFGSFLATLLFGGAQAFGIKLSAIGLDSNLASPIPYLITILGLVIFALKKRAAQKKHTPTIPSDSVICR
ncbi:MAG: ABC transporter permease [Peptoniphilaceae bacterium]|nr:ABC transporter permease [Peptoniphilaceae bacterium]MDY5765873.1 ABC transporter permease [Peptoniphilaceae bacterium]